VVATGHFYFGGVWRHHAGTDVSTGGKIMIVFAQNAMALPQQDAEKDDATRGVQGARRATAKRRIHGRS
jgi:hypothetical protein